MNAAPIASDEELAGRAIAGDQGAFSDLYERYFGKVYDLIARMLRNEADAADVAQDTFMKMLAGLGTRPPHTSFRAWLYTIARNTAIDRLRGARRIEPVQIDEINEEDERFHQTSLTSADDPERAAMDQDLAAMVWQAAKGLSSSEYALLDMNLRQGLAAEEIADAMGTTRGNVYTMLSRLRDSLEQSFSALLLARRGRRECAELDRILARAMVTDELSANTRRAVSRHAAKCEVCGGNRRRFVSAAELFGGLVPVVPAVALKDGVLAGLLEGFAAGGAASGDAGASQPQPQPSAASGADASTPAVPPAAATATAAGGAAHAGFWASSTLLVKTLIVGGIVAGVAAVGTVAGVVALNSGDEPQAPPDGQAGPAGPQSQPRFPAGSGEIVFTLGTSGRGIAQAMDLPDEGHAGTLLRWPCGPDETCATRRGAVTWGTEALLIAAPIHSLQESSVGRFSGWSGDPDCADGRITIDHDVTCIANFEASPGVNGPDPQFFTTPGELGYVGQPIRFDASASNDLMDASGAVVYEKLTLFEWDFQDDGVIDLRGDAAAAQVTTFTYDEPGAYVTRLWVTGGGGLRSEGAGFIVIREAAP